MPAGFASHFSFSFRHGVLAPVLRSLTNHFFAQPHDNQLGYLLARSLPEVFQIVSFREVDTKPRSQGYAPISIHPLRRIHASTSNQDDGDDDGDNHNDGDSHHHQYDFISTALLDSGMEWQVYLLSTLSPNGIYMTTRKGTETWRFSCLELRHFSHRAISIALPTVHLTNSTPFATASHSKIRESEKPCTVTLLSLHERQAIPTPEQQL